MPPAVVAQIRAAAQVALTAEADAVLAAAKELAPKEMGDLAASGERQGPEWEGDTCVVLLGFGGTPDTEPYALIQHERTDFQHAPGTQSHYLSQPANEAVVGMEGRIVARMARELG